MIKLRQYQIEKRDEAIGIMAKCGIVYIMAEIRTGKTLISLSIVEKLKYKRCLFITKKTAISSIDGDFRMSNFNFKLDIINFESLHKVTSKYDVVICDEIHSLSAFPKPSKRTKMVREMFYEKPMIFLSGTPSPESYSQLYHQMWISIYSPWHEYTNFYKWSKKYVDVRQKMINGFRINDYSRGRKDLIQNDIKHLSVTLTQEQAGFTQFVQETVLTVAINPNIYKLMKVIKKDKFYKMKSGDVILADTPAKMMSVFHQLSSGTIKTEEGNRYTIDTSKAVFIKDYFKGKKIAIFYMYVAEGNLLKKTFSNHTDNPEKFNKQDDLIFIKQIRSGREGLNISTAYALVLYNIDYSATSYFQARGRMQTKTRSEAALLYWIFSDKGIEQKIYEVVKEKKKYTTSYFKKEYGT